MTTSFFEQQRLEFQAQLSRRSFLGLSGLGLGAMATQCLLAQDAAPTARAQALESTHFPARAKRVIYLFQSGGPSHIDLFDHKPCLLYTSPSPRDRG